MNEEQIKKLLAELETKGAGSVNVDFQKASHLPKLSADEAKKLFKKAKIEFKEGDEERVIPFMFTDATPDRHDEVVLPEGVDLKEFLKNPVILFMHNSRTFPIGNSIKTEFNKELGGIVGHVFFLDDDRDRTGVAETTFRMVKSGTLKTGSIGFGIKPNGIRLATEDEIKKFGLSEFGLILTAIELREFSIVTVPANPNARVLKDDESIFENRELEFVKEYDFLDNDGYKDVREKIRAQLVKEAEEKAGGSGVTTESNGHTHPFTVDDKGNGTANKGETDNSKHTHKIVDFKLEESNATGAHKHTLPSSVKKKKKPKSVVDEGNDILSSLKDLNKPEEPPKDKSILTDPPLDVPKTDDAVDDVIRVDKSFVEDLIKSYNKLAAKHLEEEQKEEPTLTESFMKDVVNMKRGSTLTKDEVSRIKSILKSIEDLKSSLEELIKHANITEPTPKSNDDLDGTSKDSGDGDSELASLLDAGTEKLKKLSHSI